MRHDLRAPCAECPFRRESAAGWLGPWAPRDLLASLAYQPFPCHLTIPQEWQPNDTLYDELQACAAAALYLNNKFELSRCAETNEHQDLLGRSPAVFARAEEFIVHHEEVPREAARQARRGRGESLARRGEAAAQEAPRRPLSALSRSAVAVKIPCMEPAGCADDAVQSELFRDGGLRSRYRCAAHATVVACATCGGWRGLAGDAARLQRCECAS